MKVTYLYLTLCKFNGKTLHYVGSHTCDSSKLSLRGVDESYFGSCCFPSNDLISRRVIVIKEHSQYTASEKELIIKALNKYGSYYKGSYYRGKRRSYLDRFQVGTCLNKHWQTLEQCDRRDANKAITKEQRTQAAHKRWSSDCYNTKACKERNKGNSKMAFNFKTEISHAKAVEIRKQNNSYVTAALKVAKAISGKTHFKKIPIVETTYNKKFESIIEAEKYYRALGINISRATISQGLQRNQGNYVYKNKLNFKLLK